jgi:hypothetical protein
VTLTVSNDTTRPGGGFAVLRLDGSSLPNEIALEDRSSGLYLAGAGKWSKQPTYFKVYSVDANSVLLGPAIVDFMPSDTPVAVHGAGGVVGNVVWAEIRPSAGAASGDVMPDRAELDLAKVGAHAIAGSGKSPQRSAPPPPPPLSTPLPPPQVASPVPPVVPVAAVAAARKRALSIWLVIGGALVLALAFLAPLRNAEFAQRLVCNADGSLHESGIARSVVPCPVAEAPKALDQEELAYNGFLKCLAGKPGCAQKVCADKYLSNFPSAAHTADVTSAKREMDRICQTDYDKSSANDYAAFNECIGATANACDRGGCVERYRNRLTAEPYVTRLRLSAQAASGECKRQREEAAFATFNDCVSANEACDSAKCASGFTSAFPTSNYVSRVLQAAENSARSCAISRVAPQQAPQIQAQPADPVILPAVLENEATNAGKGLAHTLLYKGWARANEVILQCETRALTEKKIETTIYCTTFDLLVTTLHERVAREQNGHPIPGMNNREEMAARIKATWAAANFSKVPDDMTKATLTGLSAFNTEIGRINAKQAAAKARAEARQPKCFLFFCN